MQGDVFADLRTSAGRLSVYLVTDVVTETKIVTAHAGLRNELDHLEWAVIEGAELETLNLHVVPSLAPTPDQEVNRVHHDIVELSADGLHALAKVVARSRQGMVLAKTLKRLLGEGISSGVLDSTKIPQKLKTKLGV